MFVHASCRRLTIGCALYLTAGLAARAQTGVQPIATATALTIYNQNFAVVRESIPLNLHAGRNSVTFQGVTPFLEPDSVVLRDPTGKRSLHIVEQNYEADPLSQDALLRRYEGRTIHFSVPMKDGPEKVVSGAIIRGAPRPAYSPFGYSYSSSSTDGEAIVETGGALRFGLPGIPLFPRLGPGEILKPTLSWVLAADRAGPITAQLAYVTQNLSWEAAYNVVSPPTGDLIAVSGWVTIENNSGREFGNANLRLMAGKPNKIVLRGAQLGAFTVFADENANALAVGGPPGVTEKTFDEYHLYTLPLPTTLKNGETKQVEFVRAENVASSRLYSYDGATFEAQPSSGPAIAGVMNNPAYGAQSNTRVRMVREIVNSKANGLGIALPKGKVRFYRQGDIGALEFVGENTIDHTPQGETLRMITGDAFDIVGQRSQTNFMIDTGLRYLDETYEVRVRNRKNESAAVKIVEHLNRATTWNIVNPSVPFIQRDSKTIEFPVTIGPDGEAVVTYTAHYTW